MVEIGWKSLGVVGSDWKWLEIVESGGGGWRSLQLVGSGGSGGSGGSKCSLPTQVLSTHHL